MTCRPTDLTGQGDSGGGDGVAVPARGSRPVGGHPPPAGPGPAPWSRSCCSVASGSARTSASIWPTSLTPRWTRPDGRSPKLRPTSLPQSAGNKPPLPTKQDQLGLSPSSSAVTSAAEDELAGDAFAPRSGIADRAWLSRATSAPGASLRVARCRVRVRLRCA